MVDAAGAPLRVAVEGPNAGKLLAASDTSTRWDYLYALDASLNAQGQLEIRYSQDALNAGLSGAYTLLPGMQAQLNADGTTSSSTVAVSQAAWQLGLIAQGALQRVPTPMACCAATRWPSATAPSSRWPAAMPGALGRRRQHLYRQLRHGRQRYGRRQPHPDAGRDRHPSPGGQHEAERGAGVRRRGDGQRPLPEWLDPAGQVLFTAGVMNDAALYARNATGSVTLDATAWNAPVTLASHGGFNILKGNASNVSFVVQQPAVTGGAQVVLSLAQAGGSNNTVQIFKYAAEATGSARPSRPRCPNCCRPTARWSASRWTPTPTTSATCWTWATRAWSTSTPARPPPGAT